MFKKDYMRPFFLVTILFNMSASFAHPVTPTLFKDLNMPDYMFGYALAAMMAVNFLFSPFWGKLNSILSSRVCLLISCFGYSLGQFFFATSTSITEIILARMFAGLFTGGAFVSMMNYPINQAPDESTRGVWLTATATIQAVAGAFGFFVGGMLGAINVNYALIAQVVCLALSGVLFFIFCKNDAKISPKDVTLKQVVIEGNPFRAFFDSRQFMTVTLLFLFLMITMQSLGQVSFDQSLNYYLKDQFNFSSAYNGALKAAMGIITLIANSTICIYLLKKTNKKKSLIGLFASCTVIMFVVLNLQSVIPFLVVNVFFYAFSAICLPLLQDAAAGSANKENSNLVMGFFNAMKSLGGIIGALAAGSFYYLNPKYPFVCTMVAFAVGTVLATIFFRRSKREEIAD